MLVFLLELIEEKNARSLAWKLDIAGKQINIIPIVKQRIRYRQIVEPRLLLLLLMMVVVVMMVMMVIVAAQRIGAEQIAAAAAAQIALVTGAAAAAVSAHCVERIVLGQLQVVATDCVHAVAVEN